MTEPGNQTPVTPPTGPHDHPGPYPYPNPYGYGPPARPPRPPRPVDVRTSFELWLVVAALSVVSVVAQVFVLLADTDRSADTLLRELRRRDPGAKVDHADAVFYFHLSIGLFAVISALLIAALIGLAFLMRAGRNWARVLLCAVGAMLIVFGIRSIFGGGADAGASGVLLQVATILQGVAAAGAVVLLYRKDANSYFLPSGPPS